MGPAGSFENALPGSNSTIFISKLADDGTNWVDYKTKLMIAMGSRGLMGHIEGQALRPSPYMVVNDVAMLADGKTPATEEQIETREKRIEDFDMREYLARHVIINSVSMRLAQKIGQLTSSKDMWGAVKADSEGRSTLYQIDMQRWLQELRCAKGGDAKAHLTEMAKLRGELAAMGSEVKDADFTVMVIGSLPPSYRPLLSSITGAAKVTKIDLNPNDVVQAILDEYEHRTIQEHATKGDAAMFVKPNGKPKGRNSKPKKDRDVECFNCKKKGHTRNECWRTGGGAEGQGPHQRKKNSNTTNTMDANGSRKESAATATAEPANDIFACIATITSTFEEDDPTAMMANILEESQGAIIDSGASSHVCGDLSKFVNYKAIEKSITAADGRTFKALGVGDVKIYLPNGSHPTQMVLKQTLYAPNIRFTLISLSRVVQGGFAVHFEDNWCEISTREPKRRVIAKVIESNGLYRLANSHATEDSVNVARTKMTIDELHRKMGHISTRAA